MKRNRLEIAPHKAKCMVFCGKNYIKFKVSDINVNLTSSDIWCLHNYHIIFGPHTQFATRKAGQNLNVLAKIMTNIGAEKSCYIWSSPINIAVWSAYLG